MVYDDDQCPERGPGLNHTADTDAGPCEHCGEATYRRRQEQAPKPDPQTALIDMSVPKGYWLRMAVLQKAGVSAADAEKMIVEASGLRPSEKQQTPFRLRELVGIEFVIYRMFHVPPHDDLGPR